jgi:TonB family protein
MPPPAKIQNVEKPPVPPSTDQKITGVETVPDAEATTAPPTTAPGMLVPIDEADAMPVSITRKPPVYSGHAQALNLSGTVIMNVLVNEHGTVDQVVLVSGIPGADLNDSAIRAAKSWT